MDDDADPRLPAHCYAVLPSGGVILLKRGESGYWPVSDASPHDEEAATSLNRRLGVTPAQRQAMEIGSMVGWHVPGARAPQES